MPSIRTYIVVFVLLLVLMGVTIAASMVRLEEPFNILITLLIAFTKALLVVLFFMHVRYAPKLIWLAAGGSMVWLGILLAITMSDYATRGWTPNRLDEVPTNDASENFSAVTRQSP